MRETARCEYTEAKSPRQKRWSNPTNITFLCEYFKGMQTREYHEATTCVICSISHKGVGGLAVIWQIACKWNIVRRGSLRIGFFTARSLCIMIFQCFYELFLLLHDEEKGHCTPQKDSGGRNYIASNVVTRPFQSGFRYRRTGKELRPHGKPYSYCEPLQLNPTTSSPVSIIRNFLTDPAHSVVRKLVAQPGLHITPTLVISSLP